MVLFAPDFTRILWAEATNAVCVGVALLTAFVVIPPRRKFSVAIKLLSASGLVYSTGLVAASSLRITAWTLIHNFVAIRTWLLNRTRVDNYQIRVAARQIPPLANAGGPHSGNEHQSDADLRSHATVHVNAFVSVIGAVPFYLQMAACDQRRGREGSLYPIWAKDLVAKGANAPLGRKNVSVFVDVDYYLDLNSTLLECVIRQDVKAVVFYTMIPEAAARNAATSFTFLPNGLLSQVTAGGSKFEHALWDHGRDIVVAKDSKHCVFFNVERQRIGPDRYVVVYSAFAQSGNWLDCCLMEALEGPPANSPLRLVKDGWVAFNTTSAEGVSTTVAKCGEYVCATVKPETVCSMRAHRSALVQATLMNAYALDRIESSVLVRWADEDYPESGAFVQVSKKMRTIPNSVHHYMTITDDTDRPKTSLRQIAQPPYPDDTFVPMNTPGNMDRAVFTRAVLPQLEDYTPTVQTVRFVDDWVAEMARRQPSGQHPWSPEQVELVQNSAQQKRQFAEACASSPQDSPEEIVNSFQKNEPYAKAGDPRVISPSQTDEKRDLACFIYALSAHYKREPWFASGKTPAAVAARTVMIVMGSEFATEGDDSRRDGRWRHIVHMAIRRLLLHFFATKYHAELINLMDRQIGRTGRAGTVLYNTLFSLLSGSAITSAGNTLLSHMEASYGFVLMGYSIRKAVDLASEKGEYGGDDSLVGDLNPECFSEAVKLLGQSGKTIERHRGTSVTFLGRIYGPAVWQGDPSSMRDILRALRNLCVAKHGCMPPASKFVEKVKALALSDRNTPILSAIVKAVERLVDLETVVDSGEVYALRFTPAEHAPNTHGDWMDEFVPADANWSVLLDHCASSKSIDALRAFPSVKEATVTDVIVVTPSTEAPAKNTVETAIAAVNAAKGKEPVRRPLTGPSSARTAKISACLNFNSKNGCQRSPCKFEHVKLSPEDYREAITRANEARAARTKL